MMWSQGSRAVKRCAGLSIGVLLLNSCCHQVVIRTHPQIGSIFDGFVFVGQCSSNASPRRHGTCGSALPSRLTAGYRYNFHHRRPFDSAQFAASLLPRRLAESGFTVTKPFDAPQDPSTLAPPGRCGQSGSRATTAVARSNTIWTRGYFRTGHYRTGTGSRPIMF
jgi:hypothetical protein